MTVTRDVSNGLAVTATVLLGVVALAVGWPAVPEWVALFQTHSGFPTPYNLGTAIVHTVAFWAVVGLLALAERTRRAYL